MKNFTDVLSCEVCGGGLILDVDNTIDEYITLKAVKSNNINEKIKKIVEQHMIYRCVACGQPHKLSFKDIEFLVRKELTKRCYQILSRGLVDTTNFAQIPYLIYCGKCKGFDGQGSCTKRIYDSCEIKRFPIDGL
jgi:hypothetical protein